MAAAQPPLEIPDLLPYQALRHRFRNLYLFEPDAALMAPRLGSIDAARQSAKRHSEAFAENLDRLANGLPR